MWRVRVESCPEVKRNAAVARESKRLHWYTTFGEGLDDDEVPIKTLSYTDIFCVHLKAFQEQQHIIEALLARIEALEAK